MSNILIKDKIKNIVNEAMADWRTDFDAHIGHSAEKIHGDYFTNVALRLAKALKKDPLLRQGYGGQACEIAAQIGNQILAQESDMVAKVEVVHPGFLNIFLSDKFVQEQVGNILKLGKKYGGNVIAGSEATKPARTTIQSGRQPYNKKRILIEFIATNPTGQMHLGHGRNAFWGDALANILAKTGHRIKREYYINDAKASNQIRELGKTVLGQGTIYLNDYLKEKLKVNPPAGGQKLKVLIKNTKDKEKLYGEAGYLIAGEIQKDNKKFIEKGLKIKFDSWFSEEKKLYKKGAVEKMHKWLKDKNLTYEKEGAEWLKISQYGDSEDRVLARSDAAHTPTYLLPDIAYHQNKIKRGFNRLINIWGADHQGHVKSMKAAMKMLGFGGDLDILIVQMVAIKEGGERMKLSKRKGKIITLESLIDEVGLDSARFFYLMKSLDTQMELDLDLMKKQSSENPVFYVQYAHARIASILNRFDELFDVRRQTIAKSHLELLTTESELDLIKEILKFPEIIDEISRDYQVHKLAHYAVSLADKFHHFYHECRVITDDELLTQARLALIMAVKITLKNALDLLGVSTPDKM